MIDLHKLSNYLNINSYKVYELQLSYDIVIEESIVELIENRRDRIKYITMKPDQFGVVVRIGLGFVSDNSDMCFNILYGEFELIKSHRENFYGRYINNLRKDFINFGILLNEFEIKCIVDNVFLKIENGIHWHEYHTDGIPNKFREVR